MAYSTILCKCRTCMRTTSLPDGASHLQYLAFLSLKFGKGRWRVDAQLDNFSASLQHDGAKNHWFWRFRTLELCLNYDIIHLTRGSTLGPAAKNLTENRRKSHTFAFSKTAPHCAVLGSRDPCRPPLTRDRQSGPAALFSSREGQQARVANFYILA